MVEEETYREVATLKLTVVCTVNASLTNSKMYLFWGDSLVSEVYMSLQSAFL